MVETKCINPQEMGACSSAPPAPTVTERLLALNPLTVSDRHSTLFEPPQSGECVPARVVDVWAPDELEILYFHDNDRPVRVRVRLTPATQLLPRRHDAWHAVVRMMRQKLMNKVLEAFIGSWDMYTTEPVALVTLYEGRVDLVHMMMLHGWASHTPWTRAQLDKLVQESADVV